MNDIFFFKRLQGENPIKINSLLLEKKAVKIRPRHTIMDILKPFIKQNKNKQQHNIKSQYIQ